MPFELALVGRGLVNISLFTPHYSLIQRKERGFRKRKETDTDRQTPRYYPYSIKITYELDKFYIRQLKLTDLRNRGGLVRTPA